MILFETKRHLVSLCLVLLSSFSFGQNATQVDSLKQIYFNDELRRTDEILLSEIARNEVSPDSVLKYADLLSSVATTDTLRLEADMIKAGAFRLKGEYDAALDAGFRAMSLAQLIKDNDKTGVLNIVIANIYSENEDRSNASRYFKSGIDFLRKESIP